ncbi:Rgg/GadR/MutR family transcriptional regulator [Streptococcus anginosus]|uniref:Transcriptional activator, Rgg/GadR/MutR family, C-terminal domain n=1 Tax=Streptococcus anginosus subsp. whileyi CCUG 39159 TaxID=1095729 RepID=I0SD44_STRAP|nr:Rgg/GadR/MutR family transcriptional regulator [Streptococcus anginosus]AGU84326.1 transcriptional regulator [Streptococcus anginosus C238]EID21297.1 transcriptional activator, Rgg/GadR/MutR family, C-terminal domain [Streptococcus anginosus subsp. whileyi CCUG 39159]MBX9075740.1 Rgg/GadR/MutR family transcriptional regulator [Streptococcus anginosus]MDB8661492.1 Rgg/GadR/MutR family transcriptional regulator [Streptococcus anginosus]MDP1385361.1 Rgg/GadR/MutR family transcriptional regulat
MYYMGEIFKELRTGRNISLKEATGEEFSYSMLSKFENGTSDISASKLLIGLENIRTELEEFVYLVRGFQPTSYTLLKNKLWEAQEQKDIKTLWEMYNNEIDQYQSKKEEKHILNAIVIKGHMFFLDETIQATEVELNFLYDYFFSVEIWGEYELRLFSDIAALFPIDLYFRYTREMLQRVDFLGDLQKNKNYIYTILLNGLFKAIDKKSLNKAAYFDKKIKEKFFDENEAYLRIVYLFADGQHDYILGQRNEGLTKMKNAISTLEIIGCEHSANYYSKNMSEWLKEFE